MKNWSVYIIASLALLVGLVGLWYLESTEDHEITLASGESGSQAHELALAIKLVTERHHKDIKIHVFPTRGTLQNTRLLETGKVDFAMTEVDLGAGDQSRLVAELYADAFQLIAREGRGISSIADLEGKRVAIPPEGSSQNRSFWFMAKRYGLDRRDIISFPGTDLANDWLFASKSVDALFRIRAPGARSIDELLRNTDSKIIPITYFGAMQLARPSLAKSVIPVASYSGSPPVPDQDILTIATRRLLLASVDTPAEIVSLLTSVLFERRRELTEEFPLAGFIEAPDQRDGIFLPLHEGARAYFDRHEPHFLQENAEPIAVLISIIVVFTSVLVHLNNRSNRRTMSEVNNQLVALSNTARGASTFEEIDRCDALLGSFFDRIIKDSEAGRINSNDFNIFQFAYQATEDAIRDREHQLQRHVDKSHWDQMENTAKTSSRRRG